MGAPARTATQPEKRSQRLTLLELVTAISECAEDDREIVATVVHMLQSGRVVLRGTFRDEPIGSFTPRSRRLLPRR